MLVPLFGNVLSISLMMSFIIGIVILVSPYTRKRYSPRLSHYIWLIASARLMVPYTTKNGLQLKLPGSVANMVAENINDMVKPRLQQPIVTSGMTGETAAQSISIVSFLAMIWLLGVAIYAVVFTVHYIISLHRIRRWSCKITQPDILCMLVKVKNELHISHEIQLYHCPIIKSPMLVGLGKPRILLPSRAIASEYVYQVLRHEMMHAKRHDLWFKLLLCLCRGIHWFNPLVWYMVRRADYDMELSCDFDVLKTANAQTRQVYGLSILEYASPKNINRIPISTHLSGGEKQMKERISGIAGKLPRKRGGLIATLALVAVLSCGTLVGCSVASAAVQPTSDSPSSQSISLDEADNESADIESSTDGLPGEAELHGYIQSLDLDQNIYAGFTAWENSDGSKDIFLQFTDPSYFDPYLEKAKSFGCPFEVRQVDYSFNDLMLAKEKLKAVAEEYDIQDVFVSMMSNGIILEMDELSDEAFQKLAEICGVANLAVSSPE